MLSVWTPRHQLWPWSIRGSGPFYREPIQRSSTRGSLFGLQESNPVDTGVAYKGPPSNYGNGNDPMVGNKIGGVNVFGGGLALYSKGKVIVGGIGVSGDTSCTDHDNAWRFHNKLGTRHPGVAGQDSVHVRRSILAWLLRSRSKSGVRQRAL